MEASTAVHTQARQAACAVKRVIVLSIDSRWFTPHTLHAILTTHIGMHTHPHIHTTGSNVATPSSCLPEGWPAAERA